MMNRNLGWMAALVAAMLLNVASPVSAADAAPRAVKLLRYGLPGQEKPGMLDAQGNIRDLSRVVPDITPAQLSPAAMARFAALDPATLPRVAGTPRLGVPINGIRKILAIGLNYVEHANEGGRVIPKEPILFQKAVTSLSGPNDDVIRPRGALALDYECELVIVIGSKAQYVSEQDAGRYIAAYALGNDVSERDFQNRREGQWTKGKSADTFAPLGPWLVSASAVKQDDLGVWLAVNGAEKQKARTSDMLFKSHFLVSYISQFMTLEPGDVIYSGTPSGVGGAKTPPVYLQPGDVITLGIEGLGEQRQKVVAWESLKK